MQLATVLAERPGGDDALFVDVGYPVEAGRPVERPDFRVELLAADELGVSALRFVFRTPLDRPGVHVYWGSRTRWAYQIPLY